MEKNQPYRLPAVTGRPTTAIQAADYLIAAAIRMKASDIHLGVNHTHSVPEPFLLRIRINGRLQLVNSAFLVPYYKEVIARLKVLAGLNTTEIGVPQDGQIHMLTGEGDLVLRLAVIPGPDGDEVVIRLQKGGQREEQSLEKLGMGHAMLEQIERLLAHRSGLIALNGPAGSGKTSTIYAMLRRLASPERKLLTAEDPIESRLAYVSHTQVSLKTNYSTLARAFMRQDADVIFIGEVRDVESAGAAVQLAQTGHLVLTTLHTRDAVGVVARLEAFEVHANFIANSLIGSLAQRLIPQLCKTYRKAQTLDEAALQQLARISPPTIQPQFFSVGPGCDACSGGFSGRKPVFELMTVDSELADMINSRASRLELFGAARKKGMRTLAEDILSVVYAGDCDLNSVKGYLLNALPSAAPQAAPPRAPVARAA